MIQTLRPYGAIKESEIRYLTVLPHDKYAIIDSLWNQIIVSERVFSYLQSKGIPVKTLKKR